MRKTPLSILSIVIFQFGLSSLLLAEPLNDSTKVNSHPVEIPPVVKEELHRTFSGLEFTETFNTADDPIVIPEVLLADSILEKRNHAHSLLDKVLSGQRFLESLDGLSEIELPIGVVKSGGALNYSILIDRINFTSQGALMEVYVSLDLPNSGDRIAFNGKIPLSKEGGISGTARVLLLGDHPIQIGSSSLLTIKGTNNTYVEFDCNGFKGISIEAEVQFSRDLLIPEDASGKEIPGDQRVKVTFTTYAQSLNDLMVGVSIPPFQVKGLKGVGFQVSQAFMDWSDLANPPGLTFPAGYTSPFMGTGNQNLWQGFFLQRLEVRLPPSFAKRQNNQRVGIGVENMILDDQGFTGQFFAENVIEAGDMSGWSYTLDRIELGLVTNQITGFHLAGKLAIPVVKNKEGKASQFGYLAQRGADGNYIFTVSVENDLKIPLWAADVNLFTGSKITISEKDNKFYPSAALTGELTINIINKASFNSIRFENMIISSEAPHFTPGPFGFGREGQSSSAAKYPLVINNIGVRSEGDRVGINFGVTINIGGGQSEEGFGGGATLVVWGKQDKQTVTNAEGQVTGSQQGDWQFDKLEISGVNIKIKKPNVITLVGTIDFFDGDATYGDGFKGSISGTIGKMETSMQITALFGKTPAFRYWYADALVEFTNGIPLMPGMLSAYGFGGGFYSRMKQSTQPVASKLGTTPSNITYIPDENTIGVRAIMKIGTPRPEAMNGDVSLEIAINRHGGINSVTLAGNANFMSLEALAKEKMKELAGSAAEGKLAEKLSKLLKGQVFGSMRLHFDNVNDVFHGNFEVYINVAGGIVRGVSPGNKAGWAVLHFEKNDWYVHIGTPDQPLGIEVARIFKSKSYFMLGKNLPGSPPPPSQVSEILGGVDLSYMRDMNALQSGTGFAFGLHFIVDTGDLRFLMFYARFSAGTGLDFMLKDYGEEYHCAGSSGAMGINGWFANGQAYAFVQGKVGIKVNLRFYKGNFDILNIGAAAILQAKGPNPFWMKGIVGGYYKILGGMIKGQCKFEVTVGKDCVPVGEQNLLEGVNIIAAMSPQTGSRDVDVFNQPQVAFNIPVGEIFEITDMENNEHIFRTTVSEFSVMDGQQPLPGELEWNTEKDVVVFNGRDILPGEKSLKAKVRLLFEENVNGIWTNVMFDGKIVDETSEITFETSKAPDFIPSNNVDLSYPINGQVNFYPEEHDQGFIQLKDGQPYLFSPGAEWTQSVRMTETSGNRFIESDFKYDAAAKRISFTLPQGFMNSKVYRFEIVNVPRVSKLIDANVMKIETELNQGEATGTATLTTKQIEGQLNQLEVKSIYSSNFRTSQFNTFVQKMSKTSLGPTLRWQPVPLVFQLIANIQGPENFDKAEVEGMMGSRPLVAMEAVLEGNNWYQNFAYPLVYEGYPLLGWITVKRRDPETFGLPPIRNIYFSSFNFLNQGTSGEDPFIATSGAFTAEKATYNLAESVTLDYWDIQHHAINYIINNPSLATPRLKKFITDPLPVLRYGPYRLKVLYTIPGVNKEPSSYEWQFFNIITDN